tara:strand:+ start:2620 stop:2868 length:249 start_codon:yes stop_codon:yes gene_type:complete
MRIFLGTLVLVLGLFFSLSVHSEIISKDISVNSYLDDDKYRLKFTNVAESGKLIYHLHGLKKDTHKLLTCIYGGEKTVCFKP